MPPSDTGAPAPTPTPAPEEPKKPGFFARLFGGHKASAPAVPENHESQTPPPQLDETPATLPDLSVPAVTTDPVAPAPSTDAPATVPVADDSAATSKSGEDLPPTLSVPSGVEAAPTPENENNPTTIPTTPPAPDLSGQQPTVEPKDENATPPATPTQSV